MIENKPFCKGHSEEDFMADYSFDVVSKVDLNVISEAVSAANKEITNRYDFKGTNSSIELIQKDNELKLASDRKSVV